MCVCVSESERECVCVLCVMCVCLCVWKGERIPKRTMRQLSQLLDKNTEHVVVGGRFLAEDDSPQKEVAELEVGREVVHADEDRMEGGATIDGKA